MCLQVKTLVACPTCSAAEGKSKQREKNFSLLSVRQGSDLSQPPPLCGETGLKELSPEATLKPLLSVRLSGTSLSSGLWEFISQVSGSHFCGCSLLTRSQLCLKFLHS